jgi:hypothetical protein
MRVKDFFLTEGEFARALDMDRTKARLGSVLGQSAPVDRSKNLGLCTGPQSKKAPRPKHVVLRLHFHFHHCVGGAKDSWPKAQARR